MTTFTTSGFSRVINYTTSTYEDFRSVELQTVRQDADPDFLYHYSFIDETGSSPQFVNVVDPWSHSVTLTRDGAAPIDVRGGGIFV